MNDNTGGEGPDPRSPQFKSAQQACREAGLGGGS